MSYLRFLVILYIFISIQNSSLAQLSNLNLKDSSLQFVYSGLSNQLIYQSTDSLTLKSSNGAIIRILKKNQWSYHIADYPKNEFDTLRLYKDDLLVYTQINQVKASFLNPEIRFFKQQKSDTVSKNQIWENPTFFVFSNRMDYKISLEILSFRLNYLSSNGQLLYEYDDVLLNSLSREQLRDLYFLKAGDKIEISILYKRPFGGCYNRRHSVWFVIN